MLRKSIYLILFIALTGCVGASDLLTEQESAKIPEGADRIIIVSEQPAADLYKDLLNYIKREGIRISDSSDESLFINTSQVDVGQETNARYSINVIETDNGSEAIVTSEWKASAVMATAVTGTGSTDWSKAEYTNGRMERAYAYGVKLFNKYDLKFK